MSMNKLKHRNGGYMEVANTVASTSFTLKLNFKNLKIKNLLISIITSIFMFASLFIQQNHEQQKLMSVPKDLADRVNLP
jgi:hypothetical protein